MTPDFNAALSEVVNVAQSLAPTAVALHDALRTLQADARRVRDDAERLVRALRQLQNFDTR